MNFISIFTKRKRRQGPFAISQTVINREHAHADELLNNAIEGLRSDIMSSINPYKTPEQTLQEERERIRRMIEQQKRIRPSTVEQKMADLNLEKEYFKGFSMPKFKIAQHNQSQSRQLQQSDYLLLFNICIGNNIRTVEDLARLEDKARQTLLSRTIDKPTFLKLIKVCQEAQRDAPPHPGITRNQFISSRMHKIFF